MFLASELTVVQKSADFVGSFIVVTVKKPHKTDLDSFIYFRVILFTR